MPKGRNKPTAMLIFMNEKRGEIEAKNKIKYKRPFDADLHVICKPMYDKLSVEEKEFYKAKAKEEWTGIRDDTNKKLTSDGTPVAVIQRQENEKKMKKAMEYLSIVNSLKFEDDIIFQRDIFIIHVNWFCSVKDDFIPAEVAIVKFSLLEGIKDVYHCFPKVDNLFPLGSKGDAKIHSEKTHRIPLTSMEFQKAPHNLFNDILKFITKDKKKSGNDVYPLYTLNDDLSDITSRLAVESFLNWIVGLSHYQESSSQSAHEQFFQIYDLAKLLSELKLKDSKIPESHRPHYNELMFDHILRKDTYSQSPDIACTYHDEQDLIPYCSRSRVMCWVFIICNQCSFFGLPIIPGKHAPTNIEYIYDEDEAGGYQETDVTVQSEYDTFSCVSAVDTEYAADIDDVSLTTDSYVTTNDLSHDMDNNTLKG